MGTRPSRPVMSTAVVQEVLGARFNVSLADVERFLAARDLHQVEGVGRAHIQQVGEGNEWKKGNVAEAVLQNNDKSAPHETDTEHDKLHSSLPHPNGGRTSSPLHTSSSTCSKVSLQSFLALLPASRPFFELGDLVSQRLFQVLGCDAEGFLGPESFMGALYLFFCSSEEEQFRLLFNMFDLTGSGFVRKKEFRQMSLALIKGSHQVPDSFDQDLKVLERILADAGMSLYDTNKDGKLSFEEWSVYAKGDLAVMRCHKSLASREGMDILYRVNPRWN